MTINKPILEFPSFLGTLPSSWYQEQETDSVIYHAMLSLYIDLTNKNCPKVVLESIWVEDLGPLMFTLFTQHPDITKEGIELKMARLSKIIEGEWTKLQSFDFFNLEECVVKAFQLKCLKAIKYRGDIIPEVKPEFHPYSTDVMTLANSKKRNQFQRAVARGELMFGIELEFSHSQYSLAVLYSLMAMGIFKWDSSVDGEYVTLPYSYQEMVSKLSNLSSTFDKLLSANGSEGNGMHIHVSRAALTKQQMLNLQWLLNPNTTEDKYYWEAVADRELEGNRWCSFTDIEEWNTIGGGGLYDVERYVVLNFTNVHTVEFRMFKSPTNTEKVLWNLAVVAGLLEFSKVSNNLEEWMVSPLNPTNQ